MGSPEVKGREPSQPSPAQPRSASWCWNLEVRAVGAAGGGSPTFMRRLGGLVGRNKTGSLFLGHE